LKLPIKANGFAKTASELVRSSPETPLAQYANEFEVLNCIEFFVQFISGDEVLLISLFQII